MRTQDFWKNIPLACLILAAAAAPGSASAGTFRTLHAFEKSPDGDTAIASVIRDKAGNLYGTTQAGGTGANCMGGCGTVFKITKDGKESVLYSFLGGNDGIGPEGDLVMDKAGNLYGTTSSGGGSANCPSGCGTVFKIAPDGTETILNAFVGGSDGANPVGSLTIDAKGNLFGVTTDGGSVDNFGTAYMIPVGKDEVVLHAFTGGNDGADPTAGMTLAAPGALYGTTFAGGAKNFGTVFSLTLSKGKWTEKVIHAFKGGKLDGGLPWSPLTVTSAGNFLGTTLGYGEHGMGTIFKISPDGTEAVYYSFLGGKNGESPYTGVTIDLAGNLYGTMQYGGAKNQGLVYKLASGGAFTILHEFAGPKDGAYPFTGLLAQDKTGHLYGTTYSGGANGVGTVFRINE